MAHLVHRLPQQSPVQTLLEGSPPPHPPLALVIISELLAWADAVFSQEWALLSFAYLQSTRSWCHLLRGKWSPNVQAALSHRDICLLIELKTTLSWVWTKISGKKDTPTHLTHPMTIPSVIVEKSVCCKVGAQDLITNYLWQTLPLLAISCKSLECTDH